jgi:hypothetical protein
MAEVTPPQATPSDAPPTDEALQVLIDQIKTTIQLTLEEKELDAVIKKRLKKMSDWGSLTSEAQTAFSHLLAAEILSDKAAHIRIDHGVDFEEGHRSAFDELLGLLRNRRRSTSVKPKALPEEPAA